MSKQYQEVGQQGAGMGSGAAIAPAGSAHPVAPTAGAASGSTPATAPATGTAVDMVPSLTTRLLLIATLPALLVACVLGWFASIGTGPLPSVFTVGLVLALTATVAWRQSRVILAPLESIIDRCQKLTQHHGAEPSPDQGTVIGSLAVAVDTVCAALVASVEQARDAAREEAHTSLHLQRQYALMQMLRNLASMANGGDSMERALENSLREIGAYLDWPLGRLLLASGTNGAGGQPQGGVRSRSHWYCPDPARFSAFMENSWDGDFPQDDTGLIGRARQSNLSHWVSDLARLTDWTRRDAALACGLRTGFVIPIALTGQTMAFIEFYSDRRIEAHEEMLELIEAIGVELWRTASRYQADVALHAQGAQARRLASVAEVVGAAIAVTGKSGRIDWVNAGMTRLTGKSAGEIIGGDVPSLLFSANPASAAECQRHMNAALRSREIVLPTHVSESAAQWIELAFQPLPDRGDGTAGNFVLARDVTRERNVEMALRVALEEARLASQSRSQFLANMSHEIRTPMNGVLGMAELLLGTGLDDRQRRFVESLYRSGESLLDIINDILDFSRIEAGKLDLDCVDFDLLSMVEELIELLAPRAHEKRIELAYTFAPGLPATVRGDPARLRQILINIIGNAIKFTERGEVVLTVEPLPGPDPAAAAEAAATATRVRFTVRDTGIGMRPDAVERLFSVFMQVDQSSSRRYGGTGLGLAICRQLTELMGGRISATSQIGEGSVFNVELPLRHGDSGAVTLRPLPAVSLAGRRVLIAEDNPTNRRILEEQLRTLEMDCALAENGRQALQMLRIAARSARAFDIAVVDMKMPILDGMALCEQIRADATLAGLRLVMLTSTAGRDEPRQAQAIGVDAYLAKPVRQQQLGAVLATVLGSEPSGSAPQRPPSRLTGLAGRRILVAEDNLVNREVVTAMLDALGCETMIAEDGLTTLELLAREDFDVVLMDCQMPSMDGFEVMRRLRSPDYDEHDLARARQTPVIALTANALSDDAERCRAAGFSDYLAKPFRQRDLGALLLRWVRARQDGGAGAAQTPPAMANLPRLDRGPSATASPARAASLQLDARVVDDILAMERNGARNLLQRLVTAYAASSAALVTAADEGFARQDPAAVAQAVHTLKSSSANLGALVFSQGCARIEEMARRADLAAAAPLWDSLRNDNSAVISALQALQADRAAAPRDPAAVQAAGVTT